MNPRNPKLSEAEQQLLTFCQQGDLEAIESLFDAHPTFPPSVLELGLLISCRSYKVLGEHQEIIQHLLNKNADVNAIEVATGMTPLMIAAQKGLNHVIEVLVQNKAKKDLADLKGRSAVFFALEGEHGENPEILLALLEAGASPNIRALNGDTPLVIAVRKDFERSALALLQRQAAVDVRDAKGNSLLHLAALVGSEPLTRELLCRGLKNAKNFNGEGKLPGQLAADAPLAKLLEDSDKKDKVVGL